VANPRSSDPPENETAAPTGIGSGGDQTEEFASNSESEEYNPAALAARFPIIARHLGFGGVSA